MRGCAAPRRGTLFGRVSRSSLRSAALRSLRGAASRRFQTLAAPYTEPVRGPAGHEIDRLLGLADGPAESTAPGLYPQPEDERVVERCLTEAGIEGDFVALAPGSIWGSKRWPYFEELASRLADRVAIVVVGGVEDASLGQSIAAAVRGSGGQVFDACGRLTLLQSAALIGRARLLVTNDSARFTFASRWDARGGAVRGRRPSSDSADRPGDLALA